MAERERTVDLSGRRLSRRGLLRGGLLGGAGLAAAALLGCTQDENAEGETADDTSVESTGGTARPTVVVSPLRQRRHSPEPTPEVYLGMWVEDADLPFPYQYQEPNRPYRDSGGIMRIAATFSTGTLDPTKSAAGGSITVANMVYNRILGMVGGWRKNPFTIELEPELAASWERTPDGVTFTFNLHSGVHWQNMPPLDGRPFVAEDARFAFERYRSGGVHTAYWANIGSLDAPDDTTLNIHMENVTADFILPLASRYQTIYPKELVDSGEIDSKAIGTGPMILTELEPASHIEFVKNPYYWEREVHLDGVEFEFAPESADRLAGFRAGEYDYAYSLVAHIEQLDTLLQTTNPYIQFHMRALASGAMPLGMNLSNPKFADERVRQALTLAMDTQLMADLIYAGLAKTLPLHPWVFVHDEEPSPESGLLGRWFSRYDPTEAKQLLAAAGAEDLSFQSEYHNYGATALDHLTDLVIDQFAEVGITMDSRHVSQADFTSTWVTRRLKDASTSAWSTTGFEGDNYFYDLVHSDSPKNRWGIHDPQVDEWAEQQRVELDPVARREIHRTMWDYFLEKMFWPPLPSPIGFEVYQPWVRGIRFGGILGTNSSYYDWGDQIAEAWLDRAAFDSTPGSRA